VIAGVWEQARYFQLREYTSDIHLVLGSTKQNGRYPLRRPGHRCKDNNTVDLKELGYRFVDWTHLAQGRNRWRDLVNTVINFRVP
jgi:hypothetical protein